MIVHASGPNMTVHDRGEVHSCLFPISRMSIRLDVSLMSGRTVSVEADLDHSVHSLKRLAETALGVGRGQLMDSSGNVLPEQSTLKKAKLQSGDSLSLHLRRVQACSNFNAFAAILGNGCVVTWGDDRYGGDSSAVQKQLRNVQAIQATDFAFAAILGNGSVVTWGFGGLGGDSSAVQEQLRNVQAI